jgi:hypothetical protein
VREFKNEDVTETASMRLDEMLRRKFCAIGLNDRGRVTVFRETQKIKDGSVMAEYQSAVAKGEMALTTIIVNVTACAQRQDREDDYLNIYWRDGRGLSGSRVQAKASGTRATKPRWQIIWSFGLIAAGFTITR